jgi:HNH endonuclease
VAFQRKFAAQHDGALLFLGDLAIVFADASDRLWLVDGQHRFAAARELIADAASYPSSILVVAPHMSSSTALASSSSSSTYVTMHDIFALINRAVPVPDWLVQGTMTAAHRCIIKDAEKLLRKCYAPFFSYASSPRRPNVNFNALTSAFASCAQRHPALFPASAVDLMSYVKWTNARLRARHDTSQVTKAADDKAAKHGCEPLYLANDASLECLVDWLPDYGLSKVTCDISASGDNINKNNDGGGIVLEGIGIGIGIGKQQQQQQVVLSRRKSLPKATRLAVWNRFFGERVGVGTCQCCKREVTQQSFECGHVVAACNGGSDEVVNLRPLCRTCNRSMGASHMDDFSRAMGIRDALASFCIDVHDDADVV